MMSMEKKRLYLSSPTMHGEETVNLDKAQSLGRLFHRQPYLSNLRQDTIIFEVEVLCTERFSKEFLTLRFPHWL